MQRIAESEMIINSRGAIYHLDARPEEIAGTIITVGDPGRVKEVSKHFDQVEFTMQHREFVTHTGRIGSKRLTVVSTGIGPDNIDIVLNELDALANINFETRTVNASLKQLSILRFGTSGSLQGDIPVDSFVAGTFGLGLDNLLHYYRPTINPDERNILEAFTAHTNLDDGKITPYITSASEELLQLFGNDYHKGITVTCPGFYAPQGRILRMPLAYPELVDRLTSFRFNNHFVSNFEMESSAIYGLGKILGHRCVSLNVIVANRVQKEFSKNGALAVERLIERSLQVIADASL
ncbi:phosphorylase [Segetibacter sp. 3557_3]|uniref:nucleoside phosphorylase n=1 Tax=Segetibacter sp. 3557_3 TaxID=2547429 RepID=UPI0010588060|nr:nucleoside phosphorylase [Segetibacter sp. 3557_3]TDH26159.1 phosphorylase [Segetibacter sp. 3557_3]